VSKTIDDVRQLIETRLTDINAEAKQLERALVGLGERTAPRRRRDGRPRRRAGATSARSKSKSRTPRKPKAAKRAARGERQSQLLAAIKAKPSHGPADHARTLGVASSQVHALLRNAQAKKLIVKRGEGYALKANTATRVQVAS
jgi:hypothetical protein